MLQMTTSGTPQQPIAIVADGATIRGLRVRADYVVIEGLTLRDGDGLTMTGRGLVARNNVIYNWAGNSTYGGERGRYNVINNYYKPGPALKSTKKVWMINPWSPYGQFFIDGNCLDGDANVSKNNRSGVKTDSDSVFVAKPFTVEGIAEQTAEQAFALVIRYSGASLKRDAVDIRIAEETRRWLNKTGLRIVFLH